MKARLFSLSTPCPDGFTFCREFRAQDFRKAPFALFAPSQEVAREFLGQHLQRLAGVILIPGDHLSSVEISPLVLQIVISPTMLPYLADFAAHQLAQLNRHVSSEDLRSILVLENERLERNNQLASEEFSRFRASLLNEIEERRTAERQLAEREELLRLIMSSTVEAIYGIDTKGLCTFANESCLKILGYAHIGEVLGRNMHDLIHFRTPDGEPIPVEECRIFKAFREGYGITVTDEFFWRQDGSYFPVEYSSYPIRKDGVIVGAVITWHDITERKRLESELRDTLELFSLFMKYTPAYTFIKEISGNQSRVIQVSENFIDMVGKSAAEMRGHTMEELFPADFARKITDDDLAVVNEGKAVQLEEELNGRSYTTIKFPIVREGKTSLIAGFTLDITEHKRTEDAIKESEELFRSIMDLSPDIISILREDGSIKYNSPAALQIHGYSQEEMLGLNTLDLIHPEDLPQVSAAFNEVLNTPMKPHSVQYRYKNKDGSYTWMECAASNQLINPHVNGIIAISRTIDDRKKLEDERLALERQLLHAQKLESLGVLAGGIAHDFNNILMAIIGNADLALMRINKESPAVENLHRIEQSAARAADLARQMLAYSGKGKFVIENLDLNTLLEEMLHMLEVSISKKAVLRLNLHRPLPTVEADATQMRQIIMNLVINASEAIDERSGVIGITTGCMDCDQSYLKDVWLDENLTDGLYVCLEIADSGCGMSKDTLAKLFDPFFTTKFTGRGLGMAAVLGIVRGHKGAIKVYSEEQKGTTFKVLLPASSRPAELFDINENEDNWQGSGTVLLVDDEETIRGIGAEMLEELGFTAITANDGVEAVEIFKRTPDIAFVILDLTMPHMDGEQCFRELRQLKPDVKVIMSSGFSEHEVTQKFIGRGLAGFIQKPYRLSALKEVIRDI